MSVHVDAKTQLKQVHISSVCVRVCACLGRSQKGLLES